MSANTSRSKYRVFDTHITTVSLASVTLCSSTISAHDQPHLQTIRRPKLTLPDDRRLPERRERTVRRLRERAQRLLERLARRVQDLLRLGVRVVARDVELVAAGAEEGRLEHFRGGADEPGGEVGCGGRGEA